MTPAGTEPATFRFVAQHLKHCTTAISRKMTTETVIHLVCVKFPSTFVLLQLRGDF